MISGKARGGTPQFKRVEIRPVLLKGDTHLQVVSYDERQAFTSNYAFKMRNTKSAAEAAVDKVLGGGYGNFRVETAQEVVQMRVTKKGEALVHREAMRGKGNAAPAATPDTTAVPPAAQRAQAVQGAQAAQAAQTGTGLLHGGWTDLRQGAGEGTTYSTTTNTPLEELVITATPPTATEPTVLSTARSSHNREKARLLDPSDPLLRLVGVSTAAGEVKPTMRPKYSQVQHAGLIPLM